MENTTDNQSPTEPNNNNSNNNNNAAITDGNYEVKMEKYEVQKDLWPKWGKHILGQFTDTAILVYQAYNHTIGSYAVKHQKFEGCPAFNPKRMTWIKTNFLWMMFRSGWGSKPNQEMTLGIWLKREAFERILSQAVHSTHQPGVYQNKNEWNKAVNNSSVRLQWDPDHHPSGAKHPYRRAIQLGLKGITTFVDGSDIERIVDMTDFVASQYNAYKSGDFSALVSPKEMPYTVGSQQLAQRLQLDDPTLAQTDNKKEPDQYFYDNTFSDNEEGGSKDDE